MIAWIENQYGAFCPCCGDNIPSGSEDYDWGCGACGYPDPQAVADYEAGGDDDDYPCTDCGDTGITFQTDRPCSCQPAQATADHAQAQTIGGGE